MLYCFRQMILLFLNVARKKYKSKPIVTLRVKQEYNQTLYVLHIVIFTLIQNTIASYFYFEGNFLILNIGFKMVFNVLYKYLLYILLLKT